MAPVRSKLTIWFTATAPAVDSAAPPIVGRVFHVTARSSQPQSVIGWTRPPESLPALVAFATCRRRTADVTVRAPTPPTTIRRNVCLAELASTDMAAAAPKFDVG